VAVLVVAVVSLIFGVYVVGDSSREIRAAESAVDQVAVTRVEKSVVLAASHLRSSAVLQMYQGGGDGLLLRRSREFDASIEAGLRSLQALESSTDASSSAARMLSALEQLIEESDGTPAVGRPLEASLELFRAVGNVAVSPPEGRWSDFFNTVYSMQWAAVSPWDHFELLVAHYCQTTGTAPADPDLGILLESLLAGERQAAVELGENVESESWFSNLIHLEAAHRHDVEIARVFEELSAHQGLLRADAELVRILKSEPLSSLNSVEDRFSEAGELESELSAIGETVLVMFEERIAGVLNRQRKRRSRAVAGSALALSFGLFFLVLTGMRQRRRQIELRGLAEVDSLTGLANRYAIHSIEPKRLANPDEAGFALLQFDVDRFKSINDQYGHAIGDRVLIAFSECLRGAVRGEGDTVARVGGDEFVVVLHGLTDPEKSANEIVLRVEESLTDPIDIDGRLFDIRTSVGIAISEDSTELESLLSDADLALFKTKREHHGDERSGPQVSAFAEIAREVQRAVADREVACVYETQIDRRSGELVGLEVLLRRHGEGLQTTSAEAILQALEWSGQTRQLVQEIIVPGLAQAHLRIGNDFRGRYWISLPASLVVGSQAADRFLEVMALTGIPAERLGVQVSEWVHARSLSDIAQTLSVLRSRSIGTAIQHFGRAAAPLRLLTDLTLDRAILDIGIVRGIDQDTANLSLAKAVASFCRDSGLVLVAPGIATQSEAICMEAIGVDAMQGPYVRSPVDLSELRGVVRSSVRGTREREAVAVLSG